MAFDQQQELRTRAESAIWNRYQDRRKEDLKTVLSTESGRRFIATLFKVTNLRKNIWNTNGSEKDRLLGRRSVACDIMDEITNPKYADELYPLYQKLEQEDVADGIFLESEIEKIVGQYTKERQ